MKKKLFSILIAAACVVCSNVMSVTSTSAASMDEIAYTTVQSSEYTDAKEFISKIDFAECYDIPNLDPELKSDLQAVENFVSTHTHYTMEEINSLVQPATQSQSMSFNNRRDLLKSGYDYSKLVPDSKSHLNAEDRKVFNSNPTLGLIVLVQGSYANSSEKNRFGNNTWATNGDAYRHALWNALGTYYAGSTYMASFATAHEKGASNYNPSSVDTKMDLQNNKSGRSLITSGFIPSNPKDNGLVSYEISKKVASAAKKRKSGAFRQGRDNL